MAELQPGYLYILRSLKSGKYYLGSTVDLDKRLAEHNAGQVKATCSKGPWELACAVKFESPQKARSAEQWLKRMHRKDLVDAIVRQEFSWPVGREIIGYVNPEDVG